MTTMENEVSNIRAYLHIQLVMHDDSFQVIEEIDEGTYGYQVPKLILQPLVENAIDHGLDLSEKEEKKPPVVDYVREAEKALSDALGRGVKFQGGQKKGRIALEFYSADDREALMEALRHMDKPWKKK